LHFTGGNDTCLALGSKVVTLTPSATLLGNITTPVSLVDK